MIQWAVQRWIDSLFIWKVFFIPLHGHWQTWSSFHDIMGKSYWQRGSQKLGAVIHFQLIKTGHNGHISAPRPNIRKNSNYLFNSTIHIWMFIFLNIFSTYEVAFICYFLISKLSWRDRSNKFPQNTKLSTFDLKRVKLKSIKIDYLMDMVISGKLLYFRALKLSNLHLNPKAFPNDP